MASYLQNNEYNTYQVNPYVLPAQQIVQAIQTRNQYWDLGASQLKNAYSNYLNLDLTRADNKQKLNSYMQVVGKKIRSATQTDLSLASNVNEAASAFDIITKDDDIRGDNELTKHYKAQMQTAEGYRNRDNGKGYSDTNVNYLMKGLQKFATDPSAGNWRKYYNERRNYSPAHDVGKEVNTLLKDFKPSVFTKNVPVLDKNGKPTGYFEKVIDKQQTAQELNSYLQSNLSDEARTQMKINGSVAFNENYGAIGSQIREDNKERINTLNKELSTLTVDQAQAKTQEQKDNLDKSISDITSQLKEFKDQNSKIDRGDYGFIKDNYDAYASNVWSRQYIGGVAKANARILEHSDVLSPDETALTALRENDKFKLEAMRQTFTAEQNDLDRQVALLKIAASAKKKDAKEDENGFVSNPTPTTATDADDDKANYLAWRQEYANTVLSAGEKVQEWRDYITKKAQAANINIKDKVALDRFIQTYEKNYPFDVMYQSYKNKIENDQFKYRALEYIGNEAENQILKANEAQITRVKEEAKKHPKGVQEMVDKLLTGKPVDKLELDYYHQRDIATAQEIIGDLEGTLQAQREKLLSAEYTRFQGRRTFDKRDSDAFKNLSKNVSDIVGLKESDISVEGFDKQGRIYIKSKNPETEKTLRTSVITLNSQDKQLSSSQSYDRSRDLYVVSNGQRFGFDLKLNTNPKIQTLKQLAEFRVQRNPGTNSTFEQPKDWPLKLGNEYYRFEMQYVDGKQYWFPIHAKSGVRIKEELGGYDTIEQAASELEDKNNQENIRAIILKKNPSYKF